MKRDSKFGGEMAGLVCTIADVDTTWRCEESVARERFVRWKAR